MAAAAAVTVSSLFLLAPNAAANGTASSCLADGNVWVVVEHDSGTADGCATEFGSGIEALTSAGIDHTQSGGFISTVDGQPSAAGPEDWWSYWSATPAPDGTIAEWTSYSVGGAESRPAAGSVEGWRLAHSFTDEAPAPSLSTVGLPSTGV